MTLALEGGGGARVGGPLVAREHAARVKTKRKSRRCMCARCDAEGGATRGAESWDGGAPDASAAGFLRGSRARYDSA